MKPRATEVINEVAEGLINKIESPVFQDNKPDISPIDPDKYKYVIHNDFKEMRDGIIKNKGDFFVVHFNSQLGTPVRATAEGVIILIEEGSEKMGNFIRIQHDDIYETIYGSLNEINVKKGERVSRLGL